MDKIKSFLLHLIVLSIFILPSISFAKNPAGERIIECNEFVEVFEAATLGMYIGYDKSILINTVNEQNGLYDYPKLDKETVLKIVDTAYDYVKQIKSEGLTTPEFFMFLEMTKRDVYQVCLMRK